MRLAECSWKTTGKCKHRDSYFSSYHKSELNKLNKSPGVDSIGTKMLLELSDEIADIVAVLFNKSLSTAEYSLCPSSVYPNVHKLLQILATLTVSTAEPERMFSKVDLTLTDIRSTMSEDRLEALIFMLAHRKRVTDFTNAEIINKFAASGSRKLSFFFISIIGIIGIIGTAPRSSCLRRSTYAPLVPHGPPNKMSGSATHHDIQLRYCVFICENSRNQKIGRRVAQT